ncbi:uncharacterized protein [Periplaneta americana]|uniref:uncharacterized protein n=1 Tax=Periplaneta americana TaxID=6978 RepID=UPI0037E82331
MKLLINLCVFTMLALGSNRVFTEARHRHLNDLQGLLRLAWNGTMCNIDAIMKENIFQRVLRSPSVKPCPSNLTIDYDPKRRPDVIFNYTCGNCGGMRCSSKSNAECGEVYTEISTYNYFSKKTSRVRVSVGCVCKAAVSRRAQEITPPQIL